MTETIVDLREVLVADGRMLYDALEPFIEKSDDLHGMLEIAHAAWSWVGRVDDVLQSVLPASCGMKEHRRRWDAYEGVEEAMDLLHLALKPTSTKFRPTLSHLAFGQLCLGIADTTALLTPHSEDENLEEMRDGMGEIHMLIEERNWEEVGYWASRLVRIADEEQVRGEPDGEPHEHLAADRKN